MRAECASDVLAGAAARAARSPLSRVRRAITSDIAVSPVLASTQLSPRVTICGACAVSPYVPAGPTKEPAMLRSPPSGDPWLPLLTGGCQQRRSKIRGDGDEPR